METQEKLRIKDSRMYSFLVLYDMQTNFFHRAIEGISDEDAHNRLGSKANHVAWLAGSLVQQRFELAKILGHDHRQVSHDIFSNNQGIKDDFQYPSLQQFTEDWNRISPILREALQDADSAVLDAEFEMMPEMKMTNFDMVSFSIYREANCIGQIALYRRLLGYDAMRYM